MTDFSLVAPLVKRCIIVVGGHKFRHITIMQTLGGCTSTAEAVGVGFRVEVKCTMGSGSEILNGRWAHITDLHVRNAFCSPCNGSLESGSMLIKRRYIRQSMNFYSGCLLPDLVIHPIAARGGRRHFQRTCTYCRTCHYRAR